MPHNIEIGRVVESWGAHLVAFILTAFDTVQSNASDDICVISRSVRGT